MKEAAFIFNPSSGKKKLKSENLLKFQKILKNSGYHSKIYITKYSGHAKEIVKNLETIDLVISVGGDGTFNESMAGNMERKERLILSHLPIGTTNDIGIMFGLGKNMIKNLKLILEGETKKIDVCTVNSQPFVYVAGFGRFMNVPYETPRNLKKRFGYIAYLLEAARDFFISKTHMYEIIYELNGEKYQGLYSFAIISNANRIAGINNFYRNVKLNDNQFEVLFCNLKTKGDIVKSLFYLKTNDITKVPGFYFHKTSHLKIYFKEKLKKPWCVDGEEFQEEVKIFDIKVEGQIEMRIPRKEIDKLFVAEEE